MSDKRKIHWLERPSSSNWAISIVVALIGVTSIAIVVLLVITADGGPNLSAFDRSETARSTATPRPRPTQPVWQTPTPPLAQRPSQPAPPTAVPARNLPTRPAKPAVGEPGVSGEAGYIHPTYQPTSEPCSSCHEAAGRGLITQRGSK